MKPQLLLALLLSCVAEPFDTDHPDLAPCEQHGVIEHVTDGDTVKVRLSDPPLLLTVRLRGIDCPESRRGSKCDQGWEGLDCEQQIPRGKEATTFMEELALGQPASFELPEDHPDPYGRILSYIRVGQKDIGLEMLKAGHCRDFSDRYPHPREEEYVAEDHFQ